MAFLLLHLPQENDKSPLVMENILSSIYALNTQVSFEIWNFGSIQFAIHCDNIHTNIIKQQLETHYPGLVIEESPEKKLAGYVGSLKLRVSPIFPIRRYSQTSDNIKREWIDPSQVIISSLSKHEAGIQIIFKPIKWRKKVKKR